MQRFSVFIFSCVSLLASCASSHHFTAEKSGEGIEIKENGKKVLFYQQRPKSLNGAYERAGYIHPLYSLNEKILTEEFPADHPYHRGIFWAWHQIVLDDKKVADGWTSENISWVPGKATWHRTQNRIQLSTEVCWKSALTKKDKTDIVREKTRITVHRSTGQYRIVDFDIRLFALVDGLKIGGSDDVKGYGGFCLRLDLPRNISFHSKDGEVIPKETAVDAGHWVDFNGSFEGASALKSGLTAFDHPLNPDHPQRWILRREKSMQNVTFPGRTPVALSKDGMHLRYRIIIHSNEIGAAEVERLYQQYILGR